MIKEGFGTRSCRFPLDGFDSSYTLTPSDMTSVVSGTYVF